MIMLSAPAAAQPAVSQAGRAKKLPIQPQTAKGMPPKPQNAPSFAGAAALCVDWRALRRLDLSYCSLTADAAAALAAAPAIGALRRLVLSGNGLGAGAGAALARLLERAEGLEVLELSNTGLGSEGGFWGYS